MITMITTKDDDKGDEQKAQKIKEQLKWIKEHPSKENQEQAKSSRIKKNSRLKKKAYKQESRFKIQDFKNREEFKTQEESLESRIKIQDSRSQESRSIFKTQDSRMKKRLNQDKY